MRIISSFHDFYDSAMAHGQDQSVIYQRKTIEYKKIDSRSPLAIKELQDKALSIEKGGDKLYSWADRLYHSVPTMVHGKPRSFYTETGCVAFCGKLYVYIHVTPSAASTGPALPEQWFYDADSLVEFCNLHKVKTDKHNSWDKHTVIDRLTKVFDKKPALDYNWVIENKVICADITSNSVTINPQLKALQFFKVMDAYSAFQSLDMWISGTLAYPQNEMVMLDDKSMIAKHGFDKWSFRKQPEGYKG